MLLKSWSLDPEGMDEVANKSKTAVVWGLVEEGYLTKEQAEEILSRYAVTLVSKGRLGLGIDRVLGFLTGDKDENPACVFQLIKLIDVRKTEAD